MCFAFSFFTESPLHTETANASIERPTARIKSSHKLTLITVFRCFVIKIYVRGQ